MQFESLDAVVKSLGSMLVEQGWTEDPMLAAGGPTGINTGYRKGDQICLASTMWVPDSSANCPKDQPISACQVTPDQQIYTVTLAARLLRSNACSYYYPRDGLTEINYYQDYIIRA